MLCNPVTRSGPPAPLQHANWALALGASILTLDRAVWEEMKKEGCHSHYHTAMRAMYRFEKSPAARVIADPADRVRIAERKLTGCLEILFMLFHFLFSVAYLYHPWETVDVRVQTSGGKMWCGLHFRSSAIEPRLTVIRTCRSSRAPTGLWSYCA